MNRFLTVRRALAVLALFTAALWAAPSMAQSVVNVSSLPRTATVGTPYSGDVYVVYSGTNGSKYPHTFSIASGTPPPGLSALGTAGSTGNCGITGTNTNVECAHFTWTGTPTQAGTYTFTIQAADAKGTPTVFGPSDSVTIVVAAAGGGGGGGGAAPTATVAVATVSGVAGTALTAVTPVTGTGGTGTLTYSISPALGNGLSFNTATGQITGTPTAAAAATTYTVTVTDTASKTATGTFSLSVTGGTGPSATAAVATVNAVAGAALTAVTPVTGSGGTGTLTYAISPALGNGLSFNTANGQITGTPTVAAAATTYTVTVTDTASKTASATFSLNITAAALSASTAVATVNAQAGTALTPVTPVIGTGGSGALTYAISPALGNGLSFSASNGQITGTPTAAAAAVTYTVTVTDAASKTASATFSLVVAAAPVVRPDPSKNASVLGLLTSQAQLTQQFARNQLSNVGSRLQQLHGDSNGASVWASGGTQSGSLNGVRTVDAKTLTIGLDGEVRGGLVGGVAVGVANDGAKVDAYGTRVDGKSYSFSAYGSYSVPAVTVDANLSFGSSSLDTSRWAAEDSALVSGTRSAYTTFGSVALSRRYNLAGVTVEPQFGAEYINSVLGSYAETSKSKATASTLSYNGQGVRSLSWLAGVRAGYDIQLTRGLLRPVIKAEYRQINDHSQAQTLFYSDTPGTLYTVSGNGLPGTLLTGEAGVQFGSRSGVNSQLLIGFSSGGNGFSSTSFKATVNKTLGAN